MDLLHTLRDWSPLLSPLIFLAALPMLRWIVGSTLASKEDLSALAEKAHADHDSESVQIAELDTRLSVVETKVDRVEASQHEVATRGDLEAIRRAIDTLQGGLTRVETYLLNKADKT